MWNLKTVCMLLAALFSVALPVVLLLVWRKKTGARTLPFFVGMLVFFLFAMVLERLVNDFVLQSAGVVSLFLRDHDVAYIIYGSVIAGVFEETGRYLAFRTVLRNHTEKRTAVTYGIGHGGIEMILVLGLSYAMMLAALLTNGSGEALGVYFSSAQLQTPGTVGLAVLERLFAISAHIGLSVFVFFSVWDAQRLWYYPLAIWLHALIDVPAVLWQRDLLPLWQTEAIVGVLSVVILLLGISVYRKYRDVPIKQPEA